MAGIGMRSILENNLISFVISFTNITCDKFLSSYSFQY